MKILILLVCLFGTAVFAQTRPVYKGTSGYGVRSDAKGSALVDCYQARNSSCNEIQNQMNGQFCTSWVEGSGVRSDYFYAYNGYDSCNDARDAAKEKCKNAGYRNCQEAHRVDQPRGCNVWVEAR